MGSRCHCQFALLLVPSFSSHSHTYALTHSLAHTQTPPAMPSSDKNRALSSPAKELGPVGSDFAESVLTELRGSGLAQEIERSKRLDALENWEEEVHGPRYREEPSKEYIDQVKNKIYRGGFDDLVSFWPFD